ncbi:hypothetical protein ACSSS7_004766 [Eimeria intestinalis]
MSCSDLQDNLSLCVEHPRCSVIPPAPTAAAPAAESGTLQQQQQQQQQPSCLLSKGYLSLAASGALCHLTTTTAAAAAAAAGGGGRSSAALGEGEMLAVISDLMKELQVVWEPLLEALKANDATDAESLCELAQGLKFRIRPEEAPVGSLRAQAVPRRAIIGGIGNGADLPPSRFFFFFRFLIIPEGSTQSLINTIFGGLCEATLLRASSDGSEEPRIRIGINGFGRIGRLVFRIASKRPDMMITHINSSMSPEYLAYMLKYDSAHGRFDGNVEVRDNTLFVDGRRIHLTSDRNPKDINWKQSGTDFVCESTGAFCTLQGAGQHVER